MTGYELAIVEAVFRDSGLLTSSFSPKKPEPNDKGVEIYQTYVGLVKK